MTVWHHYCFMRSYLEKHSLAARFWILSVYSYFLLLFYFLCRFNWCSLFTVFWSLPCSQITKAITLTLESIHQNGINTIAIECFHMTSRRPYWCPKTIKRRPCWCPKPILSELNSFLSYANSFFCPINLNRCWPREWKHFIALGNREQKSLRHVVMVAKNSGSQQIVVLQIRQKKLKKLTCMTLFLCMIALRNKTLAHAFLPSFDNANSHLCQERLLRSEICYYGNVTSHFSSL